MRNQSGLIISRDLCSCVEKRRRRRSGEGGMVFPCFLWRSTSAEGSSSLLPFFSSPALCALPLFLPLPSTLWYADMQEFLGLKMIDQTCQPWLLLLKMDASAVCAPLIGACLSYSSCDWLRPRLVPQFMCCWQKRKFQFSCLFKKQFRRRDPLCFLSCTVWSVIVWMRGVSLRTAQPW